MGDAGFSESSLSLDGLGVLNQQCRIAAEGEEGRLAMIEDELVLYRRKENWRYIEKSGDRRRRPATRRPTTGWNHEARATLAKGEDMWS